MIAERVISTASAGTNLITRKPIKLTIDLLRSRLPATRKPLSAKNIGNITPTNGLAQLDQTAIAASIPFVNFNGMQPYYAGCERDPHVVKAGGTILCCKKLVLQSNHSVFPAYIYNILHSGWTVAADPVICLLKTSIDQNCRAEFL